MTLTFFLRASWIVFLLSLLVAGCASDWWTVDQTPYQPPVQSADETARFGDRAPEGSSRGTGDSQVPSAEAGEDTGDPGVQPRPPQ
jgi:hypothetical protein